MKNHEAIIKASVDNLEKQADYIEEHDDQRRHRLLRLQAGDEVYVKMPLPGLSKRELQGRFTVKRVINPHLVRLIVPSNRRFRPVVNVEHLTKAPPYLNKKDEVIVNADDGVSVTQVQEHGPQVNVRHDIVDVDHAMGVPHPLGGGGVVASRSVEKQVDGVNKVEMKKDKQHVDEKVDEAKKDEGGSHKEVDQVQAPVQLQQQQVILEDDKKQPPVIAEKSRHNKYNLPRTVASMLEVGVEQLNKRPDMSKEGLTKLKQNLIQGVRGQRMVKTSNEEFNYATRTEVESQIQGGQSVEQLKMRLNRLLDKQ